MYLQQGAGTLERKHAYTCGRYRNRIRTGEVCTTHYIRKSVLKELVLGELDHLFRKLYEDNALGRLSDQQFTFMVSGYDDEKAALVEKIRRLEKEVSTVTERRDDVGASCRLSASTRTCRNSPMRSSMSSSTVSLFTNWTRIRTHEKSRYITASSVRLIQARYTRKAFPSFARSAQM